MNYYDFYPVDHIALSREPGTHMLMKDISGTDLAEMLRVETGIWFDFAVADLPYVEFPVQRLDDGGYCIKSSVSVGGDPVDLPDHHIIPDYALTHDSPATSLAWLLPHLTHGLTALLSGLLLWWLLT